MLSEDWNNFSQKVDKQKERKKGDLHVKSITNETTCSSAGFGFRNVNLSFHNFMHRLAY
jgi:hypothetical protein